MLSIRAHAWPASAHAAPELREQAGPGGAVRAARQLRCAEREVRGATMRTTVWPLCCNKTLDDVFEFLAPGPSV
jgi:hypothetical protein